MFIPVPVRKIEIVSNEAVFQDSIINADEITIIQHIPLYSDTTSEKSCFLIQFKNKTEIACAGRMEDFVGEIKCEMRHIDGWKPNCKTK